MTDQELLEALHDRGEGLTPGEALAFVDMRARLKSGTAASLSHRQRQWAQSVAARLGIAVPAVEHPGKPAASAWDPSPRRRA